MEFKDRLRQLRIARGYSQISLAEALGVSKSTIGSYETGDRKPSYDGQAKIAEFFHVSVDYLRGSDEPLMFSPEYIAMMQDPDMMNLLDQFYQLNDEGKEKVLEYISDLVASGRYIKNSSDTMVG